MKLPSLSAAKAMQAYQLMRAGSALLISILLARSGLETSQIGAYESLMFVGSTLAVFWINALLQAIPPLYGKLPEKEQPAFLLQVLAVFGALAALVALLLFVAQDWIVPALTGLDTLPHVGLYAFYLLLYIPSHPTEYYYLLTRRYYALAFWGALGFGFQTAAVYIPAAMGYGLAGSLWALCAWAALRLAFTLIVAFRIGTFRLPMEHIRPYVRFAWPLALNLLAGGLVMWFDSWLVARHYRDERLFALYRYGTRELPIALALATALSAAMIPALMDNLQTGMAELKRRGRRLMHVVFGFTLALMPFTSWLFPRVFNPDFAEAAPLFNICLLMAASRMLLPNALALALGKPHWVFRVGLLELTVKVVLGFVLIRMGGLEGIVWSMLLAFWVEKLGLIWALERKAKIPTSSWLDIPVYVVWLALLLTTYLIVGR